MASSRLFVRGLPPNITESDFRRHFSGKDRDITDVKLIPQRRIGYVGYKTPEVASKAAKYFNKSYIRMSKLAVEIAKPISDHSLGKAKHNHDAETEVPVVASGPAQAIGTNKRKRDDHPDSADPKLQEYLHVMKSGRESTRDGPSAGDSGLPMEDTLVPEAESDDEYEQLPTRKEKQRRIQSPLRAAPDAKTTTATETVSNSKQGEDRGEDETMEGTEPAHDAPGVEATDDDWLRSRTNRLLDLVDPDDLPEAATEHSNANQDMKVHKQTQQGHIATDSEAPDKVSEVERGETRPDDAIRESSRLFIRNLAYDTTEDDIRQAFGKFGELLEAHLCVDKSGSSKGFAFAHYVESSSAVDAFQSMDGTTFQGRIIHIIPGSKKKDEGLDEFEISKLPLKQQNRIRKKAEAASKTFNWNSLYMSQDAVNASMASRLGVSKSELLDPTSADAAVKQAVAETAVIQETKAYFGANGVDLDAFKSQKRGDQAILVKNFAHGTTIEELRNLFEGSGPVSRVLMPPSGTIAIIQFSEESHAKTAFRKFSYSRLGDRLLFLEKAPKDLFVTGPPPPVQPPLAVPHQDRSAGNSKLNVNELLSRDDGAGDDVETTSLFVRNLNFSTTTSRLAEAFQSLDGFVSAKVKTKTDTKKPGQTLSMGFGFVEFLSKQQAQAALKVMDGFVLDDHTLAVKASHRGLDAAEERRREDKARKAAGQRTKIVIKNLPFQATKKDIRALFGTYGQLRSVRVPKKADYTARGFAFADFVTPREAQNALKSLRDTHLLGRRLVLDFAEAEAVDAEEEIEKMQRKVGGQVNKVALQKMTGGGRKRVNIGDNTEEFEG